MDEDPVLAKKSDPWLSTSKDGRFFLFYKYLDTFKSLLFYFHTFGVRRSIDVPPSENKSGSVKNLTRSGVVGLKEDVWHQEYENKKEGF